MGIIQSRSQPQRKDENISEPLRSILKDLQPLCIHPRHLKIEVKELIGVGGFGDVLLAKYKGGRKPIRVAVKQLRRVAAPGDGLRLATHLARELRIWSKLQHRNILPLVGFYLSRDYQIAQIVYEYVPQGNVMQYIDKTHPGIATRIKLVEGISAGLKYLHEFDPPICHGDLKPQNVLIKEKDEAVLGDFGLAAFIEEAEVSSGLTTTRAVKGSLRYMSPELFNQDQRRDLPCDIWSWACTVYQIITGIRPYFEYQDRAVLKALLEGTRPGTFEKLDETISKEDGMPQELAHSIVSCWNANPGERPTIQTLLKACRPLSRDTLNPGEDVPQPHGSPALKRTIPERLVKAPTTLSPRRASLSKAGLPLATHGAPVLSSNDYNLPTGIYQIAYCPGDDWPPALCLHHADVDRPVSLSTGKDVSPAQEWVLTQKLGSRSQYSVSNIKSGQYLGGTMDRISTTFSVFWWTLLNDGVKYSIFCSDMTMTAQTQGNGMVVIVESKSSPSPQWALIPASNNYGPYWIKHNETKLYLTLQGGGYAEGATVKASRETAERPANQASQWRVIPVGDEENGLFRIQNVASGTFLGKQGGAASDAAPISGRTDPGRGWIVKPVSEKSQAKVFQLAGTNFVVELQASSDPGAMDAVASLFKEGDPNQVWCLDPTDP